MTPQTRLAASFAAFVSAATLTACGDGEENVVIEADETRVEDENVEETATLGDTPADQSDEPGVLDPGAPETVLPPDSEPTNQAVIGADCKFFESRTIDFTPAEAPDVMSVRIDQTNCEEAVLDIEIATSDGEAIYEHSVAFSSFDRELAEQNGGSLAERYQEQAMRLLNTPLHPASELQPYEEAFDVGSPDLKVSRAEYEALRNSGLNYLCHWDGYENSSCIVYDPESGEATTFRTRTP